MLEDKITEKVYCYGHPNAYNNHEALSITAMRKGKNNNVVDIMAAMGGGGRKTGRAILSLTLFS